MSEKDERQPVAGDVWEHDGLYYTVERAVSEGRPPLRPG